MQAPSTLIASLLAYVPEGTATRELMPCSVLSQSAKASAPKVHWEKLSTTVTNTEHRNFRLRSGMAACGMAEECIFYSRAHTEFDLDQEIKFKTIEHVCSVLCPDRKRNADANTAFPSPGVIRTAAGALPSGDWDRASCRGGSKGARLGLRASYARPATCKEALRPASL